MPNRRPTLNTRPTVRHPECRPAPSVRGYGRQWQRDRAWHLAHNPLCADCEAAGLTVAATEVDHVESIAGGGTSEAGNLRSLCKSCHSRKTVRVDGGLGRARQ